MSKAVRNPALERFVAQLGDEWVFAQVLLRRHQRSFELRHVEDRTAAEQSLRLVPVTELRTLAQHTSTGQFRPLKSAPNLVRGWRAQAPNEGELGRALDQLYPGAVADWLAAQSAAPPITHYREFTARQTGMYRLTTRLDDAQAARMTEACCDAKSCLKQRRWTVPGLAPDPAEAKSVIPCLEPCAMLLEFARVVARWEQADRTSFALAPEEKESLQAALSLALTSPSVGEKEADFGDTLNPRRVRLLLSRLKELPSDK